MNTWDEFDALLTRLTINDYSRDEAETKRKAKDAIRTAYLEMQRRERENDTLRQMLVDLGVENARLCIDLEQQRTRAEAKVCPYHPDGGNHPGATQPAEKSSTPKNPKPSPSPQGEVA